MANGSVRIGKIFGIPIELHWLFILLMLIAFYFSILLGVILLLLFICVLIHELSHSLTAIGNKVNISKIILLPIGGASIIDDTRIDPAIEFNISLVGPLMSLFLGGIFGVLVLFTPPGLITSIVQYLFEINILLGIFNIIPAFPMDGGRVLRSYLEKKHGMYEATAITAKVSRYCMALILIGTVALFFIPNTGSFSSKESLALWNLIIVFFLYQGMSAEQESVEVRMETKGMLVSETVTQNYALIPYNSKLSDLYRLMKAKKEHIVLCKAPDNQYYLVDLFNNQALRRAGQIKDILVQIPNIPASMNIPDAMGRIDSNVYRIAAVTRGGRLIGLATGSHIGAYVALHMMNRRGKPLNN